MRAGICVTKPSPTESFMKTSAAADDGHVVPQHANHDSAEHIDGSYDKPGNRIAADEFRGAVHRTEESAFLFEFAPARLSLLLVDDPGGEIGVDCHLLAGDSVQRKSGANLGDPGCTLGYDEKVHGD